MYTYARHLNRKITRLYVTHDHPDHFFGAGLFDVPIYALPEIREAIAQQGDVKAAQNHARLGDLVPDHATQPTQTVEAGEEMIGGVRFEFRKVQGGESENLLTVALPDEDIIVVQDLVYSKLHSFVGEQRFGSWISDIGEYQKLSYTNILPGHGIPGTPALYDEAVTYLSFAQSALSQAKSGEEFKAALIRQFPTYGLIGMIDLEVNVYLFPAQ